MDYGMTIENVRRAFFQQDDNARAFRLSKEAINNGWNYPLFGYVLGYCYNNGQGGVLVDKALAGKYYKLAAEYKDSQGRYLKDQYSDECRGILVGDYLQNPSEYKVLDLNTAISYCELLLNHASYGEAVRQILPRLRAQSAPKKKSFLSKLF